VKYLLPGRTFMLPGNKSNRLVLRVFELILFNCLLVACRPAPGPGSGLNVPLTDRWQFRQAGTARWYNATVPGCVHTDLLAGRLIDEPFFSTNERKLQWIENEDWEYKTTFFVPPKVLEEERVELVFEGLDTFCSVYLNDSLVLQTSDMFIRHTFSCKNQLRPGDNTLRLYFHSPINRTRTKALQTPVIAANDAARLKSSVLARKAGYQYGSDFGPRFVSSGIWKPIRLKAWSLAKMTDFQVFQENLSAGSALINTVFEVQATQPLTAQLTVFSPEKSFLPVGKTIQLQTGNNRITLPVEIKNPQRWWTNGLGKPHLYRLTAVLSAEEKLPDTLSKRIGLKTLELMQPRDSVQEGFGFRLNGVPLYMKGANLIPADMFLNKITPQTYRSLVQAAREANFNMLRVWGGGIYESDIFYDLCDENGILVWQDLPFAGGMYPIDSEMVTNIRLEVEQNAKRIRHHASLGLWCGGDALQESWYFRDRRKSKVSAADSLVIWRQFNRLFLDMLPQTVRRFDNHVYLPFSPRYLGSPGAGDSQWWGMWQFGKPLSAFRYNTGRFMSKTGFQSLPDFPVLQKIVESSEDLSLSSRLLKLRQNALNNNDLLKDYLLEEYHPPRNFESLVWLNRLQQAQLLEDALANQRRRQPYCMGSLVWHLNDVWSGISFSLIDAEQSRKPAFSAVKRALAPVLVSPVLEGGKLKVYVISDKPEAFGAKLEMGMMDFSGKMFSEQTLPVQVQPLTSRVYAEMDLKTLLLRKNPVNLLFFARLTDGDKTLTDNVLYFALPRYLNLPQNALLALRSELKATPEGLQIELTSPLLLKNVQLRSEKFSGTFSDNFFDLLPNRKKIVFFKPDRPVEVNLWQKQLSFQSLTDTYDPPKVLAVRRPLRGR
jgi:beta-mannosidase